jgi:hypothetical protein
MVKQELVETYERLDTRRKLYEKATRPGNSFIAVGGLILFFSLLPLTPLIIAELLLRLFGITLDDISFRYLWLGCGLLGFTLMMIGIKFSRRTQVPPRLSIEEEEFLKIIESLKDIDTYYEQNIEFSKVEAMEKLSKVERDIYEPSLSSRSLWQALTKDRNQDLQLLKRNLKEKLLPTINQGGMEEIKKAYSVIERFADYLLNPTANALKGLNDSMSELPSYVEEKAPVIPFFERHPKLRIAGIEFIFGFVGFVAYYIGTKFLNISTEHAYYLAWVIWVTLTAGYMAIVKKKS